MRACPKCYELNDDEAINCNACQAAMLVDAPAATGKPLSEKALRAIEARARYERTAPSSADLTAQQWYNVAKFFREVARRASEYSHRPLPNVGPDNPLDATATAGFATFLFKRAIRQIREREPGEEG